jgi:hypothetical protein
MEHEQKFYFLIGKIGKLTLAKEIGVSYTKFKVLEKDLNKLTIGQVSLINKLYDKYLN